MELIPRIRAFNRYYTNVIGVIDRHVLNSNLSLAEARVLFEIANYPTCTQTHLIEQLNMDAGYISRIIKRFEREKLITRSRSATDGRASHLTLTDAGQVLFQTLNQESNDQLTALTSKLTAQQVDQFVASMTAIQTLLSTPPAVPEIKIRHELRPGDLGSITHYHGLWYATDFGYDLRFEGYVAKTMSEFAETYSADKDRVWIAEADGQFVGCIAVVGRSEKTAQLRWFLLNKEFRGRGLGKQLVNMTLDFCRERGYSSLYLLTTADQTTAHHLYRRVGFELVEEKEPSQAWGQTLREQQYELRF